MPLWFRIAYLLFVIALMPAYALEYPPVSFLWYSRIALVIGLIAAWTGSARLASMMLVSVGLVELGWIVDFLAGLAMGGTAPMGMVAYMFDPEISITVRGLSLYHLAMPFALFWMVWRLGYDTNAWWLWIPAGWIILLVTWLLVGPDENVNWVLHSPWHEPGDMPDFLWMMVLMGSLALTWWLSHRFFCWLLGVLGRPGLKRPAGAG